jgi:hypothetical protein
MRLRLFRGRSWWAGLRLRWRPSGSPVRAAASTRSERRPRPASPSGSHRKTGSARPAAADLMGRPGQWPAGGQAGADPIGQRGQRPASGQPDGRQARAGQGDASPTGLRPARGGHAVPSQWGRTAHARPRRAPSQAETGSAAMPGRARAAIRTVPATASEAAEEVVARSAAPASSRGTVQQDARADDGQPWYSAARSRAFAAGQRNCGCVEDVLIREWAIDEEPAAEAVAAIDRLAALPLLVKEKLAAGLEAIHVGSGGVPDLDHMGQLKGVPLPSGRATWDACAGAYGNRKIVVGSRPSPTPDVMCHEVGHALDDIDGSDGCWQSDSADYQALYGRCLPHLASEFHRNGGTLGRREFFADAFAAIASSQRPALVEMLSGDTRTALDVMLYFNVRYGL